MNKNALVTLAIGGDYLANWKRCCEADWTKYAQRHGFDVHVITEPFVESERAPAWQKCLVPEHAKQYGRIALVDSDIAINHDAPNIFEQCEEGQVGGVICSSHIHPDLQHVLISHKLKRHVPYREGRHEIERHHREAYAGENLPYHAEGIVNTGVLTLAPQIHADLFARVFDQPATDSRCYEQVPLSHALLSAGVFRQIDTRFNSVLFETMAVHHPYVLTNRFGLVMTAEVVRSEFANNFFLHFAYDKADWMRLLK